MDYCDDHSEITRKLGELSQKTADTCRSLELARTEIKGVDTRLNHRVTETTDTFNQRIDDNMVIIKRLFVSIMLAIIGGGAGMAVIIFHLYDKIHP